MEILHLQGKMSAARQNLIFLFHRKKREHGIGLNTVVLYALTRVCGCPPKDRGELLAKSSKLTMMTET